MKRYQNISTIVTSVMKRSVNGEFRAMTVKPGQIIHVDDDDIQMTSDSYNPSHANPFDRGLISEIPEGAKTHPNALVVSKNPSMKQAQDAIRGGEFAEMIEKISDFRGLLIVRKALDEERKALTDSQYSEINRLLNRRNNDIEQLQRDNADKFKLEV